MRSIHVAVWMGLVLVACTRGDESPSGLTETDSAGVMMVRLSSDVIEEATPITLTQEFRVGTVEGAEDSRFFRLGTAQESNGEVFALDIGDHRVRVFSATGAFLRAFGREGGGPGEFRRPNSLYVLGDSVVVQGQRLNLLDREGNLLATGPGITLNDNGILLQTIPTRRGWLGMWEARGEPVQPGQPFRARVTLHHIDPLSGALGAVVLAYDGPEMRVAGSMRFYITPYYQSRPTFGVGLDGHVYYTPGDAYRIDVIDGGTGDLKRTITGDFTARAVTGAMLAEAEAQERERVRTARPGSETEQYASVIDQRAALRAPETLPVFGRIEASSVGWIAGERYDLDPDPLRSGDPSTWDLFDESGRLQGRLVFPANARLLRLTHDGVLVVERDELDVQYLVRYRWSI